VSENTWAFETAGVAYTSVCKAVLWEVRRDCTSSYTLITYILDRLLSPDYLYRMTLGAYDNLQ